MTTRLEILMYETLVGGLYIFLAGIYTREYWRTAYTDRPDWVPTLNLSAAVVLFAIGWGTWTSSPS